MENREYEYDRYEVKLSRLMNIEKDFWWCLVLLGFYALIAFIAVLVYGPDIQGVIILSCFYLIVVILKLRSNPGRLEITRTTVHFQYRRSLLTLFTKGRIYYGGENAPKYTDNYTVYNIRSMEYLQTPFEKFFSCGHICLCGDVNLEFGEKEERTFTIYGVKRFDDISAWMKDFMILSSDDRI